MSKAIFAKKESRSIKSGRVLMCAAFATLIFPSFSLACDYYASPNGNGNGLSQSSPFKISSFWSKAGPGKTLCLLDGTYTGSNSMIDPPGNLNGSSGNPITVRALNDGKVDINGQGARMPVSLNENDWFVLEGFNAHDSSGTVIALVRSDNNVVRRVIGWNAPLDTNNHVFGVPYSKYILLEDVAGFGKGRKIFETYQTTDITIRRAWGRWEGSTRTGPKQTFAPVYNAYGTMIENSIGTWSGEEMSGSPDQPFGTVAVDRIDGSNRKARVKLLGDIFYVSGGSFHPNEQLMITKLDDIQIKDLVAYFKSGQNSSKLTIRLADCKTAHSGGSSCSNPDLTVENFSSIGGSGHSISSHWQKSNVKSGSSVNDIYSSGETLFVNSGNDGATICKRYVDGALTNEPLWPWPMDQRIYDALDDAGKSPFFVTDIIESMFGTIPSECTQGNQGDDPPSPPTGLQFTSN